MAAAGKAAAERLAAEEAVATAAEAAGEAAEAAAAEQAEQAEQSEQAEQAVQAVQAVQADVAEKAEKAMSEVKKKAAREPPAQAKRDGALGRATAKAKAGSGSVVDGKLSAEAQVKRIEGLVRSSHELDAAVDARRAEGEPFDEALLEAARRQLYVAMHAAEMSAAHASTVNAGAALEAAIGVARRVGIDVGEAEQALADCFFLRLSPSYTDGGRAKNVLTLDNNVLDLPELTQATLLQSLNARFMRGVIYTNVGDITVSVNPFKPTGSVGPRVLAKYRSGALRELPPHVYGLISRAYQNALASRSGHGGGEGAASADRGAMADQSVVISGESGAGKTEAMKICLSFLTMVGDHSDGGEAGSFSSRLMQTNPVMEALGNATTVRNNNSSRFGKHFDIQIDTCSGGVLGAFTSVYLLEKPRIETHTRGERNYHMFYMLLQAPSVLRAPWGLSGSWEDYAILSEEGSAVTRSTKDHDRFGEMAAALLALGFSEAQREELFRMVALVLQLGNLQLAGGEQGDGEASSVADVAQLELCALLLQVEPRELQECLCFRRMGGGAVEEYTLPRTATMARVVRNSMCMHVYALAFSWVVQDINGLLAARGEPAQACIGLLDIFGFENFARNSFPQLCINFTNELLHNMFIGHVIKLEQEVYVREGVKWELIDYSDNAHVLTLISKPPSCIFGLLDDACKTGSSTDANVLQSLHERFSKGTRGYVRPRQRANQTFCVVHYAGQVTYDIGGFVAMNKAELSAEVHVLLEKHSGFVQLKELAAHEANRLRLTPPAKSASGRPTARGSRASAALQKATVARDFSKSVEELLGKLRATTPHYIRCLKPNQKLEPLAWDQEDMEKQVAFSGLLEVAKVRQAGFANRRELQAFFGYYKVCLDVERAAQLHHAGASARVSGVVEALGLKREEYLIGKRLIFFTAAAHERLDAARSRAEVQIIQMTMYLTLTMRRWVRKVRAFLAPSQADAPRTACLPLWSAAAIARLGACG